MKKRRININDVASMAMVSKSTVSNYLNGRYESMSEDTRSRLTEVIEKLNYAPDLSARRLSTKGKSHTICLIIPRNIDHAFRSMFFGEIMRGIGRLAEKSNYNIMLFTSSRERISQQINYIKGMTSSIVDGFMIFDILENDKIINEFQKSDTPYVCFGKLPEQNEYKYVATDHEGGAFIATSHLLSLGHKRIALLNEQPVGIVSRWRNKGFLRAFYEFGVIPVKELICTIDDQQEEFYKTVYETSIQLLNNPNPPTAFIITAQHMSGFMSAVREKNMSIPDDLSVIVLEYYSTIGHTSHNFTRIPSKAYEVGEIAFKKLLRLIYNSENAFESVTIPVELIHGDTCRNINETK